MATYLMLGKYSPEALRQMSVQRTDKAKRLVEQFGGEIKQMYAALGPNDLVFVVELPGIEEAMKASIALTKLTGIAFSTTPAVEIETFDRLAGSI